MAAASTEVGGLFADGEGHEIAQYYGVFLWAGVFLYVTTAWRVLARRDEVPSSTDGERQPSLSPIPTAHFGAVGLGESSRLSLNSDS
jgi:hypothetical protein